MGVTSAVDENSDEVKKKREEKDNKTTTVKHGFRITGMTIKDEKGEKAFNIVKGYEDIDINKTRELLRNFLKCNGAKEVN